MKPEIAAIADVLVKPEIAETAEIVVVQLKSATVGRKACCAGVAGQQMQMGALEYSRLVPLARALGRTNFSLFRHIHSLTEYLKKV